MVPVAVATPRAGTLRFGAHQVIERAPEHPFERQQVCQRRLMLLALPGADHLVVDPDLFSQILLSGNTVNEALFSYAVKNLHERPP